MDTQMHPELEPGVGSRFEYEYSVTRVAAQGGLA